MWHTRGNRDYDLDDIVLLKIGRHIRPREHFKLIVARDEGETNFLHGYRKQFTYLYAVNYPGPITLIDGVTQGHDLELAARIAARYSRGKDRPEVAVKVSKPNGEHVELNVAPFGSGDIPDDWFI